MAIWYILWLFWVYFPRFGMLYQEKSGKPALKRTCREDRRMNGKISGKLYQLLKVEIAKKTFLSVFP
jgi:hypothetical protein